MNSASVQKAKIYLIPLLAWIAFAIQHSVNLPALNIVLVILLLLVTMDSVHHAEIIALRIGEPFGTLVLALAVISLTIPVVSFFAIYSGVQLTLGIDAVSTILFLLSLFITILSLSTGKTTVFQGILLLVVFIVYLFTIIFP
jgi:Ca2+/H+ antiporter